MCRTRTSSVYGLGKGCWEEGTFWNGEDSLLTCEIGRSQVTPKKKQLADQAITAIRLRICLARKLFNPILLPFYLIIKLYATSQLLAQSFQPSSQPLPLPYYLFLLPFWNHLGTSISSGLGWPWKVCWIWWSVLWSTADNLSNSHKSNTQEQGTRLERHHHTHSPLGQLSHFPITLL